MAKPKLGQRTKASKSSRPLPIEAAKTEADLPVVSFEDGEPTARNELDGSTEPLDEEASELGALSDPAPKSAPKKPPPAFDTLSMEQLVQASAKEIEEEWASLELPTLPLAEPTLSLEHAIVASVQEVERELPSAEKPDLSPARPAVIDLEPDEGWDKATLIGILPARKAPARKSKEVRVLIDFLVRRSELAGVPLHELKAVFAKLTWIQLAEGQQLYSFEDAAGPMYIFLAGELEVESKDHTGALSKRRGRVGEALSVVSCIHEAPCKERVTAVETSELFVLSGEDARELYRDLPHFRAKLLEALRGDFESPVELDRAAPTPSSVEKERPAPKPRATPLSLRKLWIGAAIVALAIALQFLIRRA